MKHSLKIFLLGGILISLISFTWMVSLFLKGQSSSKLVLMIFFGVVGLVLGWQYISVRRRKVTLIHPTLQQLMHSQKTSTLFISSAYLFVLSGFFILATTLQISDDFVNGIISRLRPLIFFVSSFSALILFFFAIYNGDGSEIRRKNRDRLRHIGIISLLLFTFVSLNIGSLKNKTFTTDEPFHYQYGVNLLSGNTDRFDDSKMPFSAFNALLPTLLSKTLNPEIDFHQKYPLTGRIFTILFSTLSAFFVYFWSAKLFGRLGGYFSLLLYIFDPNIIAHSRLITTDIFATGMILISFYTFWLFYQKKSWSYGLLNATVLGLSQLAKYTSAYLYPIFLGLVIIQNFPQWLALIKARKIRILSSKALSGLTYFLVYGLMSLIIINCGYLFNRSFTPLAEYSFRSEMFQEIQAEWSIFGEVPIPVPYPYLEGLDWVKERERTGHGYGRNYLFGELRQADNFNGYFIYAAFLKVPIASQILILGSIIFLIGQWKSTQFWKNESFLVIPVLFFFIYFNFLFRAQMGIRYYLVIFPFLYILCGKWVQNWSNLPPHKKLSIGVLVGYLVVSVGAAYPHYIPYFNEFVWDQTRAYKYLVDSNLDWTQAHWYLEEYRKDHPEAIHEPPEPTAGLITASPNRVAGIANEKKLRWLRENFKPVDTIADTYLIYEISVEEVNELQVTK